MNSLAALVKRHLAAQRAGPVSVVPRLEEFLSRSDLVEAVEDRRDGKFHPSDLASPHFCSRAWALFNFHPDGLKTKAASVDPRLLRIFDNGKYVHSRLQWYLDKMGVLLKDELKLQHDPDSIVGHTDGILQIDMAHIGLEIKSINSDGFRWLSQGPKTVHVAQTHIYLHCHDWMVSEGIEKRRLDGFLLLYECKDNQQLKEFYLPRDDAAVAQTLSDRRDRMTEAQIYAGAVEDWKRLGMDPAYKPPLPACHCPPKKESPLCLTLTV